MESEEEEKYCSNCKRLVATTNFAIHSAFCERNIFVCKICKEPVGISEKDEHFENYHVISPCDLCEAPIEKWMLPDHMEICPKRLIVCQYCEAEFPLNVHTEHLEFCGSRTEKCLICQKYIMMKDKAKHTELHKCEQKYQRRKIDEEIKQNKVNEVISNRESYVKKSNSEDSLRREENRQVDSRTRMGANFEGMKEPAFNKTSYDPKRMDQDLSMLSLQGATALPDRAKEKSSRYGQCHICKLSIPWIDMNTHIPSCASLAGKCSLCGEDVPNHAMKDHMRGHISGHFQMQPIRVPESPYPRRNSSDRDQNDAAKKTPQFKSKHTDDMKSSPISEYQCQSCHKMIPRRDKNKHEASDCEILHFNTDLRSYFPSPQSFHECLMCSEQVPEENWQSHISFGCKTLLESRPLDTPTMRNDSSEDAVFECPLCLAWMPSRDIKKHELFECKTLIDCYGVNIPEPKSYADSVQKTGQCSCRKKANNCGKCKNKPQQRKVTCPDCKDTFECGTREEHHCQALRSNKNTSNQGTQDDQNFKVVSTKHRGAVPGKTSLREMLMPSMSKCKYCNTTLNSDIMQYHEVECVHQPVDCPECQGKIPIKDLDSHECKKKKRKDMKKNKRDEQVPEEKTESGFGITKMFKKYVFNASSKEEKDERENVGRQHNYPYNHYPYSYNRQASDTEGSQPFYYQEDLLPCEFCNEKFPASQLVLHETGCQPDLVSHAKPEPSGSPNLNESSAKSDSGTSITRFNRSNMDGIEQPFFSRNTSWSSNRKTHKRKSDARPGEFLPHNYEESLSRSYEGTGNESKGKKEEYRSFQSVWNSEMMADNGTEDKSEEILKRVEDPMVVDKFDDPNIINARNMTHGSEFLRQTSQEIVSKDDMRAFWHCIDESEIKEKHGYEEKSASYCVFGSDLLEEHKPQKNHRGRLDERKASIDGESARLFRETTRSVAHSSNNEIEIRSAIQQLEDLRLDTYKLAAMSYEQIPVDANLLEKKDYEPEVSSKQKNLLDAGAKINKGSIDNCKKYLPDLKFASQKSSNDDNDENNKLCVKDGEVCDKLLEKDVNKTSAYERVVFKEDCADSLKSQMYIKFGIPETSASFNDKNVYKTKEDEELIKESHKNVPMHAYNSGNSGENVNDFKNQNPGLNFTSLEKSDFIQECNRLMSEKYDEVHKEYFTERSNNSNNSTDSAHLTSEKCSLKNTQHETFLQKNEDEEPVMAGIENTFRNTAGENECISNYKKFFPDFKFADSDQSTISKENSIHHVVSSNKNALGAIKKVPKQDLQETSKHSDCSEIESKSFSSLAMLTSTSNKSTAIPRYIETHHRKLPDKGNDPEKFYVDQTSTCTDKMSKSEVDCSNDLQKYLPQFKFGSQLTKSSEDKTFIANLSDKDSQLEESVFKLQAAQLSLNESADLQLETTWKKIKDLETRIANNKKQTQKIVETVMQAKWRQLRETSNSSSSDSE